MVDTKRDEKAIDDFCVEMKKYWNSCTDELRTNVKVSCLKAKLSQEDYLKGCLAGMWMFFHIEANKNRKLQIVK